MTLPHYLRNLKYQEECTATHLISPSVTDAMLGRSCTLEGFIIPLLRVSVLRLTNEQKTTLN